MMYPACCQSAPYKGKHPQYANHPNQPLYACHNNPTYIPYQKNHNSLSSSINRIAQISLKAIGAVGLASLSIMLGAAASISGMVTILLFGLGSPSCILTGVPTILLSMSSLKFAQAAVEVIMTPMQT